MKKKQIDEKQLLTDAMHWFEKKHGVLPDDCNMEFFEIWREPTIVPFVKKYAVVFAPTTEIGEAFIWEQNAIYRAVHIMYLAPFLAIGLFITIFRNGGLQTTGGILMGILFCLALFCHYQARKCKKCEQIHQWEVDIYHSGL